MFKSGKSFFNPLPSAASSSYFVENKLSSSYLTCKLKLWMPCSKKYNIIYELNDSYLILTVGSC